MKKAPTIQDVAKQAGVSIATVSRYINHTSFVDSGKAQRIKAAIEDLEFVPNSMARGLKNNRTNQIYFVVPDICNPFYSTAYKAIQKISASNGFMVCLYNTNDLEDEESNVIKFFQQSNAGGLIFCSTYDRKNILAQLDSLQVPIIMSNAFGCSKFDTVHSLPGQGLYLTTMHHIKNGHKSIAYVGGSADSVLNKRRKSGCIRALEESHLHLHRELCFEMDFTIDCGYKAGKYFYSILDKVTAFSCANDLIAIGLMQALCENGVSIPKDVSIAGMDDIEYAALCRPSLTTVSNNSTYFGEQAATMLFDRILGRYSGPAREIVNERTLVVRGSTGVFAY
ncbi:MAG: LacI family DNA-binding transcriptional regulator [Angelakisella sp.]|nr:LacI family DNA-binding transcriptional regulator [Angelakisella sp.]